ncbi:hypothetical protein H6F44_19250 [Pseudanabaena sp. FACHB-1277]|jgi:hypothetical protein|uniref:Uncharacterized protein n=1 Tax=Pseudanabaena cinerea FACHB-1277 TaxID=2949581 RepID=A0A926Z824_9CYAN|nr:hypothetical protein [Pseudanabaena cinerea]MBD2152238.1 hypothetical protein [Pseudanabaena cinerea FACHB-1277]
MNLPRHKKICDRPDIRIVGILLFPLRPESGQEKESQPQERQVDCDGDK